MALCYDGFSPEVEQRKLSNEVKLVHGWVTVHDRQFMTDRSRFMTDRGSSHSEALRTVGRLNAAQKLKQKPQNSPKMTPGVRHRGIVN